MSFEDAWPRIAAVKGWLAPEEARALYEAAAEVPPGRWIVEIGSHHGKSTTALALGRRDGVPLLAIDPLPDEAVLRAFRANMERVGADVELFRGTSDEAAAVHRPEIGLLFVDGAHDRASVLSDIDRWEPLVREGGVVAFHDAFFRRGVTEALFLRHLRNRDFRYVRSVVNLSIFARCAPMGAAATAASGARMTGRLPHLLREVVATIGVYNDWRWLQRLFPPHPDFEYRTKPARD